MAPPTLTTLPTELFLNLTSHLSFQDVRNLSKTDSQARAIIKAYTRPITKGLIARATERIRTDHDYLNFTSMPFTTALKCYITIYGASTNTLRIRTFSESYFEGNPGVFGSVREVEGLVEYLLAFDSWDRLHRSKSRATFDIDADDRRDQFHIHLFWVRGSVCPGSKIPTPELLDLFDELKRAPLASIPQAPTLASKTKDHGYRCLPQACVKSLVGLHKRGSKRWYAPLIICGDSAKERWSPGLRLGDLEGWEGAKLLEDVEVDWLGMCLRWCVVHGRYEVRD